MLVITLGNFYFYPERIAVNLMQKGFNYHQLINGWNHYLASFMRWQLPTPVMINEKKKKFLREKSITKNVVGSSVNSQSLIIIYLFFTPEAIGSKLC